MAVVGNIKTVKLGTSDQYEINAKYIQDGEGVAKQWSDIVDLANAARLDIIVVDTLPTASADTMHNLYLVPESGSATGTYVEYVTVRSGSAGSYTYSWERIGTTDADLSNKVDKGTYTSETAGAHTHSVSGNVTVPTVAPTDKKLAATASGTEVQIDTTADAITGFGAHTKDSVLGADTTFTVSGGAAETTNIKATASGAAVQIDSTADAITGFGAHTTDDVLGADTTFAVSGGAAITTNIKATASGAAVSTQDDDFVQSYPGVTSELQTGSVRGVAGTTVVPSSVSAEAGSAAAWSASVDANGELSFSWTANVPTAVTVGAGTTVAISADADTDVLTGLGAAGTGGNVLTGLGTAVTAKALTSATVSAQPTIALETGATAGTGVIAVATGVEAIGVTANANDTVAPITALGTPTTAAAATAISVKTQPTIALETGAASGTGVVAVATGVTAISVDATTVDLVDAITALGTPTTAAAATAISVKTQPTINLNGDASTGVDYVAGVAVGSETVALADGAAAEAGGHVHDVILQ